MGAGPKIQGKFLSVRKSFNSTLRRTAVLISTEKSMHSMSVSVRSLPTSCCVTNAANHSGCTFSSFLARCGFFQLSRKEQGLPWESDSVRNCVFVPYGRHKTSLAVVAKKGGEYESGHAGGGIMSWFLRQ